jgi:putative addiction module killer protein
MFELLRFQREDGREPFTEWLNGFRDKAAQARIRVRLRQLQAGNFGDVRPIGGGLSELRIHIGAGYRVYFAGHGKATAVLLCGGDKDSQAKDIKRAQDFWRAWKQRQH